MNALAGLTKPQWDAALEAARVLTSCSPDRVEDRAQFREAKAALVALLPTGADAKEIIRAAVRWDMLNAIASVCAGLPMERAA